MTLKLSIGKNKASFRIFFTIALFLFSVNFHEVEAKDANSINEPNYNFYQKNIEKIPELLIKQTNSALEKIENIGPFLNSNAIFIGEKYISILNITGGALYSSVSKIKPEIYSQKKSEFSLFFCKITNLFGNECEEKTENEPENINNELVTEYKNKERLDDSQQYIASSEQVIVYKNQEPNYAILTKEQLEDRLKIFESQLDLKKGTSKVVYRDNLSKQSDNILDNNNESLREAIYGGKTNFLGNTLNITNDIRGGGATISQGVVTAQRFVGDGSGLTGISSSGSFSTSSILNLFSTDVVGFEYSTSTGVFSLDTLYNIPTNASTTDWNNKVSSQWINNGSDIIYSLGKVGIGTSTPGSLFSIGGGASIGSDYMSILAPENGLIVQGNSTFGIEEPITDFGVISSENAPSQLSVNGNTSIRGKLRLGQSIIGPEAGAIIIGDISGNDRGTFSIDLQTWREDPGFVATGPFSIAVGGNNTVLNTYDIGIGYQNIVDGNNAIAIGTQNEVVGYSGVALGYGNNVSDNTGFAIGYNNEVTATNNAFAIGYNIINDIANSVMIGPSDSSKVTILQNGMVGIGTTTPTTKLSVVGDVSILGGLYDSFMSKGVNGMVLQSTENGFNWVATSTLGIGGGVSSPWITSGNDIYYNTGNIGIGTATFTGGNLPSNGTNKTIINGTGGTNFVIQDTTSFAQFAAIGATEGNFAIVDSGATTNQRVWNFNSDGGVLKLRQLSDNFGSVVDTPMTWLNNGNVGIGTTIPSAKLDVLGSLKVGGASLSIPSNIALYVRDTGSSASTWKGRIVAGGDNVAFLMGEYNSQAWLGGHNAALNAWAPLRINPDGTSDLYLGNLNSGGAGLSPIITLQNSNGRVGIGTTTPSAKLDIYGTAGSSDILALSSSTNSRLFTVASNGNVGIGVAAPSSNLQINSSSVTRLAITSGSTFMSFGADTTSGPYFMFNNTQDLRFATANSSTGSGFSEKMRLTSTGNLGVGTTSPQYRLHVVGDDGSGNVAKFQTTSGATSCTLNSSTGLLNCSSDQRLKKDITQITSSFNKLNQLNPVSYLWKTDEETSSLKYGFLAQEIEKVFPEIVSTDSDTGYKSVGMNGLIPFIVDSIQEMANKLTAVSKWFSEDGNKLKVEGEICVDDVCISKEEFKDLLIKNGADNQIFINNQTENESGSDNISNSGQDLIVENEDSESLNNSIDYMDIENSSDNPEVSSDSDNINEITESEVIID